MVSLAFSFCQLSCGCLLPPHRTIEYIPIREKEEEKAMVAWFRKLELIPLKMPCAVVLLAISSCISEVQL